MDRDCSDDIAIVGVAGRFPGCADIESLWSAVASGRSMMRRYRREDLISSGVPTEVADDPDYVPIGGHLSDANRFENTMFRITPRDAELMAPEHRHMLETAWGSMEDAAAQIGGSPSVTGVFASGSGSSYLRAMLSHRSLDPTTLEQALHGTEPDFIASLISYKLGLIGPAIGVQTACSSGLVGIHLARQSLLAGECDQAVVVAAGIGFPQAGHMYTPGGIMSKAGVCRPFDAKADGVVAGAGAVSVVLRRSDDAMPDGPQPYGVIVASAVNNDGARKAGYFAPSSKGQEDAIIAAYAAANIDASLTGYLETHGTGTRLGDLVEWSSATAAFSKLGAKAGQVAIGALKANIGHLDSAAGIAGLVRSLHVLREGIVPPVAGFTSPNPGLDVDTSPLYIPGSVRRWESREPRRASVSSFGIGGTNAHVIVEQARQRKRPLQSRPSSKLILLSAPDIPGLIRTADRLAESIGETCPSIEDVSYSLGVGRAELSSRLAVTSDNIQEVKHALASRNAGSLAQVPDGGPQPLVFLFPGQGSQRPGMALPFAQAIPGFQMHLDRCLDAFAELGLVNLKRALFDMSCPPDVVTETAIAQPALFATEYALASSLADLGLSPSAVAGHSLGEVTAASVSGTLDFVDAVRFVCARARVMQECRRGSMLSLWCDEATTRELISDSGLDVEIAAINASELTVVGGRIREIERFVSWLDNRVPSRKLSTSHAFHTSMMSECAPLLKSALPRIDCMPLRIPMASGLGGQLFGSGTSIDFEMLIDQIHKCVRFADAIVSIDRHFVNATFLEVGPGHALSAMMQHAGRSPVTFSPRKDGSVKEILDALGSLWVVGQPLRLSEMIRGGQRIHLPGHVFGGRNFVAPEVGPVADSRAEVSSSPDRHGLPKRECEAKTKGNPGNRTQATAFELMRALWTDLLGARDLAGSADFIDLGGDSMLLSLLAREVKRSTGIDVSLRSLMSARTLDGHTTYLEGLIQSTDGAALGDETTD